MYHCKAMQCFCPPHRPRDPQATACRRARHAASPLSQVCARFRAPENRCSSGRHREGATRSRPRAARQAADLCVRGCPCACGRHGRIDGAFHEGARGARVAFAAAAVLRRERARQSRACLTAVASTGSKVRTATATFTYSTAASYLAAACQGAPSLGCILAEIAWHVICAGAAS